MRTAWANLCWLGWIVRVLAAHGLAHALGRRLTRRRWLAGLARRLPPGDLSGPRRLAAVLENLGGTFIKLGQMLALQPDILSLAYCNALFDLMDRVAPFAYPEAERVFRDELGETPDEAFDRFDRWPIASASIGQVYVAERAGRRLAVKVQRPSVDVDFAGDIRLMTAAIGLIRRLRIQRLSWLIEPTSEFIGWTREELDYRNEARYMEQLRRNAAGNPAERVPAVAADLSTARVLTVDFLDGVTVLDYLRALDAGDEVLLQRLAEQGFDPGRFARHMIDNFLGDAFRHGIFHADLHPANLMILPGDVVGYIDFGITGVISHYSRYHLVMLTLAYTRADLDGMCAAFLKVSAMDATSDVAGFRAGLERLADAWYERRKRRRQLRKNFTLVMLDMLRLSRQTGIWPERDVIKYIRSAIAIDGLITRFAPGFDVGRYIETVCDRALRQQARQALFSQGRLLDWAGAGVELARDGAFRAADALDRLAAGAAPPPAVRRRAGGEVGGGRRAFSLSIVAGSLALLMAASGQSAEVAVNLFTAEGLIAVASLAMLTRTLYRLA